MNLADSKAQVTAIEQELRDRPFIVVCTFERDGRRLSVALTERLQKRARKGKVWKAPAFLTALKNAQYGFDETDARSRGGADGIFLLDRCHRPANEMMRKIFGQYLDRPGSGAQDLAVALGAGVEDLLPVRLVSHHMRLLGVLHRADDADWLVLVDWDATDHD